MNSIESVLVDDQPESLTNTGRYKTKYKTVFLYLFDFFPTKDSISQIILEKNVKNECQFVLRLTEYHWFCMFYLLETKIDKKESDVRSDMPLRIQFSRVHI